MSGAVRRTLVLVLLLILIGGGWWYGLYSPQRVKVAEAKAARATAEAELASLQQEVTRLQAVQADAPNVEAELLDLARHIPDGEQPLSLFVQIRDAAAENNLQVVNLTRGSAGGDAAAAAPPTDPAATPAAGGAEEGTVAYEANGVRILQYPLDMTTTGTYEDLRDFLRDMETSERLISVRRASFVGEGNDTLSASLSILVYGRASEGGAAADPAAAAVGPPLPAPVDGSTAPATPAAPVEGEVPEG